MQHSSSNPYQALSPTESALVKLAKVGMKGSPSAIRKMANQLIRSVPQGVLDAEGFRTALHSAVSASESHSGLVFSSESLPMEAGGAGPLVDVDDSPMGSMLVLNSKVQSELDEIVLERKKSTLLASHGLVPSRSALFAGPPGVGKTLASRWIAEKLNLPLVSLDLSAVLSSYLGTSGRNIRAVLEFAKSNSCVLLLDEFDALAKARNDNGDVGELKRVVNVLLVELDRWNDRSFLIAATNHEQLLDPAIERRFDRTIDFPLPGLLERISLIDNMVGRELDATTVQAIAEITEGRSPSDLTRLLEKAARRSVLQEAPLGRVLLRDLMSETLRSGPSRDVIWQRLHRQFDVSLRRIAEISGVSHPTVAQAIRRVESEDNK